MFFLNILNIPYPILAKYGNVISVRGLFCRNYIQIIEYCDGTGNLASTIYQQMYVTDFF